MRATLSGHCLLFISLLLVVEKVHGGNDEKDCDNSLSSYGVDVTWPIHHYDFSSTERPSFVDVQKEEYHNFMQGCRDFYGKDGERCDLTERDRIAQNLDQPASLKIRAPEAMWTLLEDFFSNNFGKEQEEVWPKGDIYTNHWASPTWMLHLGEGDLVGGGAQLRQDIHDAARPILEEWSGIKLSQTQLYGVRIYKEGSILNPHVDRQGLVVSAIVNVAQDVDEPWMLDVIDRQGKSQNITMEPGDMVLYESRTLIHGRSFPLRGRYYANVFIHFEPMEAKDKEEKDTEREQKNAVVAEDCPKFSLEDGGIQHYLNPNIVNNKQALEDIGKRLREGGMVVIEDAFDTEFAEAMHCHAESLTDWELNENYFEDGFMYRYHNLYEPHRFTDLIRQAIAMFEHPESKAFMTELSGRDCSGDSSVGSSASMTNYLPGDHSLPHTDHTGQHTVRYLWHLSKNWDPSWGGALYWASEHINNSFQHASFNTLILFSVTSTSSHFVTTVSPHAAENRLTLDGFYHSSWLPSPKNDLDDMLATPEQRNSLTLDQISALWELIEDKETDLSPEQRTRLEEKYSTLEDELWPGEFEVVHKVKVI